MDSELTKMVAIVVTAVVLVATNLYLMENSLMSLPMLNNNVGVALNPSPIRLMISAVAISVTVTLRMISGLFNGPGPPVLNSIKTVISRGAGSDGRFTRISHVFKARLITYTRKIHLYCFPFHALIT